MGVRINAFNDETDETKGINRMTALLPLIMGLLFSWSAQAERPGRPMAPEHQWPRFTYDLGVSAGSVGDRSYSEAQFGVNTYFDHWLAWRNAAFARLISDSDNLFGLDTSLRGIWSPIQGRAGGATFFAGPGYRFANKGKNVPFAEGGLVLRVAGLALGGGVKTFFNKAIDSDLDNDTQYFIILSGAGTL